MYRKIRLAFFLFVVSIVTGAVAVDSPPHNDQTLWPPILVEFPDTLPPPTVPKTMIATLRLGRMPIVLEKTELNDVQRRLGGKIRAAGDASEAIAWLAYCGNDSGGRWALSVDSGEIGGLRWIDGFTWERLDPDVRIAGRCRVVPEADGGVELPIALRLGMTDAQVRKILGGPTMRYHSTLIFDHEHTANIHNMPYSVSNTVAIALRDGVVRAIRVTKDTEN